MVFEKSVRQILSENFSLQNLKENAEITSSNHEGVRAARRVSVSEEDLENTISVEEIETIGLKNSK